MSGREVSHLIDWYRLRSVCLCVANPYSCFQNCINLFQFPFCQEWKDITSQKCIYQNFKTYFSLQGLSFTEEFQKPGDVFCRRVIMTTLVISIRQGQQHQLCDKFGSQFFFPWVAQTFRVQNLGVYCLMTPASCAI